nr:unnamed protein product [Digitaria exilis]
MVVDNTVELDARTGHKGRRPTEDVAVDRRLAVSAPPGARSAMLLLHDHGDVVPGKLVAAAAIKEVVMSPTRSSPRLAGVSDQLILERAKIRAAWKNLDREDKI